MSFYCNAKSILHKLNKGKSVAVTDNFFLKAYFSMAIKAKDLQQEVNVFMNDSSSKYHKILENVHTGGDCIFGDSVALSPQETLSHSTAAFGGFGG